MAIFVMILVALIVYSNTFNSAFQFDDIYHIVQRPNLKTMDQFTHFSTWTQVNERPVPMFTLAVNYQMGQLNETGYHVFNLIFHIISGIIVYYLVLLILSLPMFAGEKIAPYRNWFALLMALLFLTHPIQTQAVTYVIQRITVLASLFYLLSVFLYIKGRLSHIDKGWGKETITYYCLTFVSFVLAVLSKQIAVTIPLALLMTEFYFIRDKEGMPYKNYLKIGSGGIALGIILSLIFYGLPNETKEIPRHIYLFTEFRVLIKYIQLLILPVNQNLDYDIVASTGLFHWKELLSMFVIIGLIALAIYLFNKKRLISYGIAWFFLTLSVESTIIPIRDFIYEHRLYLPIFGFLLVATYLLFSIRTKVKTIPAGAIIMGMLILAFGITAHARNRVWKTQLGLWTDVIEKSPDKGRPYIWQGIAYSNLKNYNLALKCFDKSVDLLPKFPMAYYNRANVEKELGKYAEALKDYDQAIEYNPKYAIALFNRGVVKAKLNRTEAAVADYNKSLELEPDNPPAYYNRGNAYRIMKSYDNALADYDKSLKMDSKNSLCYLNRGLTKAAMKNPQEALQDYDKAIQLDPKNYLFYNAKGVSLYDLQRYDDALNCYNTTIKMKPDYGLAYYNRAFLKMKAFNDSDGACADFQLAANNGYKGGESAFQQMCKNQAPANQRQAGQQQKSVSKSPLKSRVKQGTNK
jgi:tetratricopeptide (TPR) repeat protein